MKEPQKTSLLNQLRLTTNDLLSVVGFELVRRPRRGSAGLVAVQVGQFSILIPGDSCLWRQYFNNPEYGAELGRLAKQVFQTYPAAAVIDIGANVGDTAAIVKSAVDVPVFCVEGDAKIWPVLKQNVAAMNSVTAYQCFLGDKTEQIRATVQKAGWDSTIVPTGSEVSGGSQLMSLFTLDDVVMKNNLAWACKLLKVDVEGFDLKVLRGAPSLLRKDQPVIIFEWNHENLDQIGEDGLGIFPYLSSLGYEDLLIFDAHGKFMLPAKVTDSDLLRNLYEYSRSLPGLYYYDLCVFSKADGPLARQFLSVERGRQVQTAKPLARRLNTTRTDS